MTPHSAVPVRLFNCQTSCKLPTHHTRRTQSLELNLMCRRVECILQAMITPPAHLPVCRDGKVPRPRPTLLRHAWRSSLASSACPCSSFPKPLCRFRYQLQWFWNLLGKFLFLFSFSFLAPNLSWANWMLSTLSQPTHLTSYLYLYLYITSNFIPLIFSDQNSAILTSSIRTKYPSHAIVIDNNLLVED